LYALTEPHADLWGGIVYEEQSTTVLPNMQLNCEAAPDSWV